MDEILDRIMDSEKWPCIGFADNLELLNELANKYYEENTFPGMLSALLMYHQIVEAMCYHLIEDCRFQIQLSIYPETIHFPKLGKTMFGDYVKMLNASISFNHKEEFIKKVEQLNQLRNNTVHEMRKSNLDNIPKRLRKAKPLFDEIYDLYDEIQDNFRVVFHDFKKDVFLDYIDDEDIEDDEV